MGPHPEQHPTDERILLLLLYQNNREPVEGITRLQKLIFLIQEEIDELGKSFDYEPYDYGPFSKELYNDIDELVRQGFVEKRDEETPDGNDKYTFRITNEGVEYLRENIEDEIIEGDIGEEVRKIKSEYNSMSILALLDEIYEDYEDYAAKSKLYKY